MTLEEILCIVDGKAITQDADLSIEIERAFGADLMSDVLAFVHTDTLLLTGLTNPQVVRTAEMAGVTAILFVRGKYPPPATVSLAETMGISLIWSPHTMYGTSGRLYMAGLPSGGSLKLAEETWDGAFDKE